MRNPLPGLIPRSSLSELKKKVKNQNATVLHLHGMPGMGKTELVRSLSAEFPSYVLNSEVDIWVACEIDCREANEDLEESLEKLLQEMVNNNILTNVDVCHSACSTLKQKRTQDYVKLLCQAEVPVLIIVQDPSQHHQGLLIDFVSSVKNAKCSQPLHLYITSNSKRAVPRLSESEMYEVSGLTEDEGLKLLEVDPKLDNENKRAAITIYKEMSGSPLGLSTVLIYCDESMINYKDYLKLSTSPLKAAVHQEEGMSGDNQSIFKAIIRLLDSKGLLDEMKTIAMFHNSSIPRVLIGKVFQCRRKVEEDGLEPIDVRNEQESGKLMFLLKDTSFCQITERDEKHVAVTLNQLVFAALQAHLDTKARIEFVSHLKEAVEALSAVVHKDLRHEEDLAFMKRMKPHIRTILQHVVKYEEVLDNFLIKMATSHLHQVLGVIESEYLHSSAEENFKSSASIILQEVSARSKTAFVYHDLEKIKMELTGVHVEDLANACLKAGRALISDKKCLCQYALLVLQLKQEDVDYLLKLSSDDELTSYLKSDFDRSLSVGTYVLEKLRSKTQGMFLGKNKYSEVFFINRLVSVLHSTGRLALYKDEDVSSGSWKTYFNALKLANALSAKCRECSGVCLLLCRLTSDSMITLLTEVLARMRKTDLGKTNKITTLQITRKAAVPLLKIIMENEETQVFETGLRKSTMTKSEKLLLELRTSCLLVRLNTKLWRLWTVEEQQNEHSSVNEHYETLCSKTNDAMKEEHEETDLWNHARKCIVYCGKYLAARGYYTEALQHFTKAYECDVDAKGQSKIHPWISYNYARSVSAGNLKHQRKRAIQKCQDALQQLEINQTDLRDLLHIQLTILGC